MPATPTPSDSNGRFTRPDASMSLLTNVMDHSLDEGYAEAARRGDGPTRLPTSLRGKLTLAIGLALAATVVTVAGVNTSKAEPTLAKERDALVHRVNDATKTADTLQRQVQDLRKRVGAAQQEALPVGGDSTLAALGARTGTGEISGPGIKLVIEDAAGTGAGGSVSNPREAEGFSNTGRLRDRDLQLVVNGLWLSGAEAVSINGQRLTTLSAIRAAGDAVLVDNRPLVPPYTVLAIGDGERFAQVFDSSSAGRYLKLIQDSYGIKSNVSVQKKLSLPAALGVTLRTAKPGGAESAASAGPGASGSPSPSGGSSASPGASPSRSAGAGGPTAPPTKSNPTRTGVPSP
ncbi:DUF881 domain-containing protein [Kitasatospora sp. NPDC085879]|uniref:DUF881 domain-containing protein n=1 Tax=Kitasatospora sp. NPDC085879 TaxID=3154769 RepID=UPI00342A7290